jgi:hypothetical protein
MNGVLARGIATAVAIILYGWINFLLNPTGTILTGQAAGQQFSNSDTSYVASLFGMRLFSNLGLPVLVLLVVIVAIWWGPLRRWWSTVFSVVALCVLFAAPRAEAYYEKNDYTEAYTVLPNESAFWIPDTGANKDSQGQFDSEPTFRPTRLR